MLSLIAHVVLLTTSWLAHDAFAQVATGSSGACGGEAHQAVNQIVQEVINLRSQITQAQLALADIDAMEQCAARQMVWVAGYVTADAGGCISVEEFRGPPGDRGPQGEAGGDATCP
ncbi:MAG: hypothetical protein ACK4MX_08420 [Thermaurantiacus sp.]